MKGKLKDKLGPASGQGTLEYEAGQQKNIPVMRTKAKNVAMSWDLGSEIRNGLDTVNSRMGTGVS